MADQLIMSVTQLNKYVRSLLEDDPNLTYIFVVGEISNFKAHYQSGHMYFSLKDEGGVIRSVMFRSSASKLKFTPENGMRVVCRGRVSLYERDGQYQFYAEDMQPDGAGSLAVAFEQIKKKLLAEGLFDVSRKKPIPSYPEEIAVITSDTGAAVKDIFSVLDRRYPLARILFCPVLVQGESAAKSIADAIKRVNALQSADVIIAGRGGGSVEDLWAFNEEAVARAVAESLIPVISAVGHETDTTICDMVADLRAPTPSAAAEMAVPDASALLSWVYSQKNNMIAKIDFKLGQARLSLDNLIKKPVMQSPLFFIDQMEQRLDLSNTNLSANYLAILKDKDVSLRFSAAAINALSPLGVLSRGYAICYKGGKILKSVKGIKTEEVISVNFVDGTVTCDVKDISEK